MESSGEEGGCWVARPKKIVIGSYEYHGGRGSYL